MEVKLTLNIPDAVVNKAQAIAKKAEPAVSTAKKGIRRLCLRIARKLA